MRILVCGGRDYSDYATVKREILKTIYYLNKKNLPLLTTIIHGNASGADVLAQAAAEWFGMETEVYSADWTKYGKSAGYIRNKQMLVEGKPDIVIAFPGGKGTANMVKIAKEAGVEVIEIKAN